MDEQQQLQHLGWDWDLLSDDDNGDEGFLEGGKQQQQLYSSSRMMVPMEEEVEEKEIEEEESTGEKMMMMPPSHMNMKCPDWDPVSQVSLKNIKETDQFVEIKVDSSVKITTPPAVMPWTEGTDFQENLGMTDSADGGSGSGGGGGGMNLWKWGLSGIGAICSFGVATVCIAMLNSQGQGKNHGFHLNYKNQNCSNDQRMKHLHAIVIGRGGGGGIPMTTAHITSGGYYDSSL